MNKLANSIFFLAVSVVMVIAIPACGGGGSSGDAVAAAAPTLAAGTQAVVLHETATYTGLPTPAPGPVGGYTTTVLKDLTFVPTNGVNDAILRIEIDAMYSQVPGGNAWLEFELLDPAGKPVSGIGGYLMGEVGSGKRLRARSTLHGGVPWPAGDGQNASYTIRVYVFAGEGYSGSVQSFKLSILVAENVATVSPSPNIY